MNIVLIGYRGTGKSSIGTVLAQRLGWKLISTDAEICQKAQLSIPEIIAQYGWDHFRTIESEVCQIVSKEDHLVIDTGGGVIVREENIQALKTHGLVFWLTATVSTIAQRIGGDTQRPSLTRGKSFVDEIEEVLQERTPSYQAAAHYIISTDDTTLDGLSAHIFELLTTHSAM